MNRKIMKNVIVYDYVTGEIKRTCKTANPKMQAGPGERTLRGAANDETQYVDVTRRKIIDKPAIQPEFSKPAVLADGVDEMAIANLPQPCKVRIHKDAIIVKDGVLELSIDQPGKYKLSITAKCYLPWEGYVEAQAAS
jgi:hypothetical protein